MAVLASGCAKVTPSQSSAVTTEELPYGDLPLQRGELRVPIEPTPRPVVVLVHGGYWRHGFTRAAMEPVSEDLTRLGYATWNLDYRTVDDDGGGWPGTAEDVGRGIDHLTELARTRKLDLSKVIYLGHSAGAQLTMWAAARTGRHGRTTSLVQPQGVVVLSGVLDLSLATRERDGGLSVLADATTAFLGGMPDEVPSRYAEADPMGMLPMGIPLLLLHGGRDAQVPPEHSRGLTAAATRLGDQPTLIELPSADHFDVIRKDKAWFDEVLRWLPTIVGQPLG